MNAAKPWTPCTIEGDDVLLHVVRDGGPTSFYLSETDTLTDAELYAQTPINRAVAAILINADRSWCRHVGGWTRAITKET